MEASYLGKRLARLKTDKLFIGTFHPAYRDLAIDPSEIPPAGLLDRLSIQT